ncbi:hypothetical protein ACLSSQ_03695 [Azospira sp. APE16]|uniref:Uncharacterized protein n=1 Tax=Azospira oryzae TaxID=146939 RepID=A0ABY0IUF6_9RHOO|nr:hypothetical protein [Azospira oryzae]RZT90877.1 hypothetical protein EV678_1700 [Azospira oryzae]
MADNLERLEQLIESILRGERESSMTITQLMERLSQPLQCERLLEEMH